MIILLDLDETLIAEVAARDRAALDFLKHFASVLSFSEADFPARWHDLQKRHFQRFTRGEVSFQEHRRERLRELFAASGGALPDAELDARFEIYLARYEENWALFDDVIPFLERARHCKLGIATNGDSKQQRDKLRRTGIAGYFQTVIVSSEIGVAKPEPGIFLEACRVLSVAPDECTFIGDRIDTDIEGSMAAGMDAVWLNRGGYAGATGAFRTVRGLGEIEV